MRRHHAVAALAIALVAASVLLLAGGDDERLVVITHDSFSVTESQEQIAETMFVYPVVAGPRPVWWKWATVAVQPAILDPSPGEIERWIREWTAIVRR